MKKIKVRNINFKNFYIVSLISIIIVISVLIGIKITKKTYSNPINVSDEFLISNVTKLNNILKSQAKDLENPYYIREITDENGNVPAYKYYNDSQTESREINGLIGYNDKIFLGLGDYTNNTGPVKIIYYNTITDKIESSGTIKDQEVLWFNIIDNKLYTTATDPIASWGYGSYYVYNEKNNNWDQHKFTGGWIHVYDIVKYNNKLFMCGSVNEAKYSMVQVSTDGGETFDNTTFYKDGTKIPFNSSLRVYKLIESNGSLFAYAKALTNDDGTVNLEEQKKYDGIYIYNNEDNSFSYVDGPKNAPYNSFPISSFSFLNSLHFRHVNFNGKTILVTSALYEFDYKPEENSVQYPFISSTINNVVSDAYVLNDELYILTYKYNNSTTLSDIEIYKTKNLKKYDLVYKTTIDSPPRSMTIYNNNIYIGGGYYSPAKAGALYKIDLSVLDTSINVDEKNKILKLIKDGLKYDVEYDLYDEESIFETTLKFDSKMTTKRWQQEFTKFKNLYLIYSLLDNKENINLNISKQYYEKVISSNINNIEENYTNSIEFAQALLEQKEIKDNRFNITFEEVKNNDSEIEIKVILKIPNIEKITSEKYIVNEKEKYIYVYNENDTNIIKENLKYSDLVNVNVVLQAKKIFVRYGINDINMYDIIKFDSEKEIVDNSIYTSNMSDSDILETIDLINGEKIINNNKLQIKYKDTVLDEYNLIRYKTNKSNIIDDNIIYIGNLTNKELNNDITLIGCEKEINNNELIIKNNDKILETRTIYNIEFGKIINLEKTIYIPLIYTYEDILNNIKFDTIFNYKIFLSDTEITSGNITKDMIIKIYYNDVEIDSYDIENEYINIDDSIKVEDNKLYVYGKNIKVSDFISKIDTTGKITLRDNNDILDNDDLVGTGRTLNIKLISNEEEYVIIVYGDVNGNGLLEMADSDIIGKMLYEDYKLTGIYKEAADFDNNSIYDLEDVMKLAKYIIGGN